MWAKEQHEAPEPPVTCSLSQGIAKCSFCQSQWYIIFMGYFDDATEST